MHPLQSNVPGHRNIGNDEGVNQIICHRILSSIKKILWLGTLSFCALSLSIYGSVEFKIVESWDHGDQPFSRVYFSTISPDGNVVVLFGKAKGIQLITPKKLIPFGFFGEGTDELMYAMSCFPYKNGIGFQEDVQKRVKVFMRTEKGMKWKESIWFQKDGNLHIVKASLFADDKFFFAGEGELPPKNQFFLLQVYDNRGKILKKMAHYKQEGVNQHAYMSRHLLYYRDQVFLISEDKLSVHVISTKDLSEKGEMKLTAPAFYKKMPDSFYTYKKYPEGGVGILKDLETWSVGYSRIFKAEIEGDYIVLALRTLDPKLKRFCLLYYRADTFKLAKQIFLDDYLLGIRDGRYYCLVNGESGIDENTDQIRINVYQYVNKK